ncbi:hypothetical protein C0993_007494 [Termitomyces sp. T159_Od127]|nr:hypothetical protein C0993_007494 [Termitomyces sp. T159_Od127]
MSSSPGPSKSRWTRLARRASMALAPTRPSTPSTERDSDTASLKGSVRSVPITQSPRSVPITQSPLQLPPKQPSIPSPIPESPVQTSDSIFPATTAVEQSPLAQTTTASEPPTATQEYTPPPLIDSTAVGPGGFTDDPDSLPKSQPIRDPSLFQPDSTDGHEPLASVTVPTTTSGPGGFSDSGDLPQPQTIKEPSLQRTESTDSHKPPVVESIAPRGFIDDDLLAETQIARAPSPERTEPVESDKPRVIDSSTVGLGGFNDDFDNDLPQPRVIREPPSQEPDMMAEPVLQTTRSSTPTKPTTEPSTPVREHPAETPSYFDLPVVTESESHPEATEEFKKQVESVFPSLPNVETPQQVEHPSGLRDEPPQPPQEMPAPVQVPTSNVPDMPTPEPSSVAPGYSLPPFESGQEVWGGVAHPQPEETRDMNTTATMRSRASSVRSMPTENPFTDPITPRITVHHHDQGTSSAMPEPQTSNPYSQAPTNPNDDTGVVVMPLPPMHEVIPSRSVYEQSNQTLSNTVTGYYETDERLPLLPQATSSKVTSYLQPSAASRNIINVSPQSGIPPTSTWPTQATHSGPRLREFGWIEYHLPDGIVYYVHPTRRVTADIDLRDERRLDAMNMYFERHRDGVSAPAGMELWLIEDRANSRRRHLHPLRFLVNHSLRMVAHDQSSTHAENSRRAKKAVEDDPIDIEFRYWSFMEAHPAHVTLPPNARAEAMDTLTWAWTDRLLPAHHPVPAPFTQEECQELTSLLRSFGLDNFARIAGFVAILFASFSMVSTLVALFRWKAEIDNPISHIAGEGLMKLSRRSVIMALPVVFLVYAIIAFVTGIVLYSFWGTVNDTLSPQQPFNDYIKWTVIGVLGGLGGMLFTSLLLFGR